MRELARIFDIGEVFVVDDDRNRMWGALKVMFPFRKCKDNSKEFPIINVIVLFCQGEGFGEICTGMEIIVHVLLHEDYSCSKKGSIRYDMEGTRYVRDHEDREGGKDVFEGIERALVERGPNPGDILMSDSSERGDNVGII